MLCVAPGNYFKINSLPSEELLVIDPVPVYSHDGRASAMDLKRCSCVAVSSRGSVPQMESPLRDVNHRGADGSPVGGGACSSLAGGPSSSMKTGFNASAQT